MNNFIDEPVPEEEEGEEEEEEEDEEKKKERDLRRLIKPKPKPIKSPSSEVIIRQDFESIQARFPFETFKFYKGKYNDWDITIHPTPTTKFAPILENAMQQYGIDGLHIRAIFPPDYPYQNIFLCLWYPKIKINRLNRAHIGSGTMCLNICSKSNWFASCDIGYVLAQYISWINEQATAVCPPSDGKFDMEVSRKHFVELTTKNHSLWGTPDWIKTANFQY